MDADDVSLPHRFSVQLPLIESGADLVGAGLVEFADDESEPGRLRVPPIGAFNHPTVVYRRSAVLKAGGYQFLPLLEDYWLFTRMIAAGATVANVAEPLVMYRVGSGAYDRRGGLRLLRSEIGLQRRLRREDFTTTRQMVRNLAVRGGYRLTPVQLRRLAYRRVFTSRNAVPSLDSLPTLYPARPTSLPRP